ncbi:Peptidyl-prolyl isomerase CWC27 [Pleurostoma richardsiae]|uniref:peptidylprolyl isomerase n=1 Tax=Pleurostoma richardsiae TaxID=41990 RepID=A0AA38R6C4_9PEZI|nr:Peptidyl-prolyl isomerase CWC27 [Pleurostoma richardsiae]
MSTIYNTEPQPTASVILHTTGGDIAVELWTKQTPLTCRNFLQLCLDGYYDNTIFHRLVPGFILQGGDPTGTGNGGESIYDGGALSGDLDPWPMDQRRGKNAGPTGVNFKDEFHSRLKFNRRGLLGMANEGVPDSNSSQFFFTLGKTEELNGKNTLFGRVAGDTIYNLAKIGESEIDEATERPLYPVRITSVEILINPFEDMRKRERVAQRTEKPAPVQKKKDKKRKGGKQLLSFGDEEGDEEETPVAKKAKFDTRIVIDVEEQSNPRPRPPKAATKKEQKEPKATVPARASPDKESPQRAPSPPPPPPAKEKNSEPLYEDESSPEPEIPKKKTALEQMNEEIAALKASMKRTIHTEPVKEEKKSALEQMIPEKSVRGRKRRPGGNNAIEDQRALDILKAFQSKLGQAPPEKKTDQPPAPEDGGDNAGDVAEDEKVCDLHFIANCQSCKAWDKVEGKDDSDDEGWMSHSLSFAADKLGKDLTYRKKAEEELMVIDPREKARTLQEEKKAQREARAGGSGRAWDQARNAQMAKASALAGRGAR